jgi:hypothetical protein
MKRDLRGVPVSSAHPAALAHYEAALHQFHSYTGDPVATIDQGLREAPDFVPGHLLKALVLATMAERRLMPGVRQALAEAQRHASRANDRERGLIAAVRQLVDGEWDQASLTLDRVLVDQPRDVLALQAGHLLDFYRGDAANLRNRVSRVLPHWDAALPGYSFVLGMHAFGLEEMNQYADAEATALRALTLEPKDAWAVHAAVHVMEMQGRIDEGIAFLRGRVADWAPDNGFAFHNFWHLALFMLDGARYDDALALYDRHVRPGPQPYVLSLIDATALLWRLALEGIDVASRFEAIADEWEARLDDEHGFYAFNDLHAMIAFAATGRGASAERARASLAAATVGTGSNAAMARDVGLPLADGIAAFSRRRYAEAIAAIEPVRDRAHRFGGSHAQRDLLTLTLIEAALRAGETRLARHYIAERAVQRPGSRWASRLYARAARGERFSRAA